MAALKWFFQRQVAPQSNCPEVTDTHDPVFFTVFKILLDLIPQQTILVTDSALHTSHPCQQLLHQTSVCTHMKQKGTCHILTPHSSNDFQFQLNSATCNFYLWSFVTWVHSAALGGFWDKQDELRLSQFFQSEMLPLYYSANLLAAILASLRLSLRLSTTLCRDWKIEQLLLHPSNPGVIPPVDLHQSVSVAIHTVYFLPNKFIKFLTTHAYYFTLKLSSGSLLGCQPHIHIILQGLISKLKQFQHQLH